MWGSVSGNGQVWRKAHRELEGLGKFYPTEMGGWLPGRRLEGKGVEAGKQRTWRKWIVLLWLGSWVWVEHSGYQLVSDH